MESEKTTTIVVPVSLRDKLYNLKKDRNDPLWRVINRLLGGEE